MKRTNLAFAVAGTLLISSGSAYGAEWFLKPKISTRVGYNDNLTITTRPHNTVEELDLIPEASFGRKTETSGITGQVRFDARRYWGESGLNTNDRLLNLHMYDNGQRMGWTLDGNITRDTTLQSELNATGLVLQRTPRLSRSLNPGWSYMINERTRLNLGYQYQDVRYPDQATPLYQNYRISTGTARISHQYSQRLQLFASGSVTYYRTTKNELPIRPNFKARYDIVQGGANYAFSQTLNGSLSAGVRRSTTTTTYYVDPLLYYLFGLPPAKATSTSTGSVVSASLQKHFETSTVTAQLSRNIQPTGYGGLIETDRLGLTGHHRISAKFSESLNLAIYRTSAVSTTAANLNRTFLRVEPAFTWNLTRWWHLQGSYRYARQRYKHEAETAVQNAAYVTLSYTWPRITASR